MQQKLNIGGQAVIEGIMMKSPNFVSVGVRKPDNKIVVKEIEYNPMGKKYKFLTWPFFRGVVMLFEMLVLGIKALTLSANEALDEENDKQKKGKKKGNEEYKEEKKLDKKEMKDNKEEKEDIKKENEEELSGFAIAITIFFSLVFAIALFVVVPYVLTTWIGIHEEKSSVLFNIIDGIIKLAFFILYVVAIGLIGDVKKVFQYHGAEHKAVNCYESGLKLNVKNCKKFSTVNARCGTSFLLFVILIGIVLFSFVPILVTSVWPNFLGLELVWRKAVLLVIRILFLLPLAALSYEFLKLTARCYTNKIIKIITWPGLFVQKLTTREPSDDMLEVAIKAIEDVLKKEKRV